MDLQAYYAEMRRRSETAQREFAERSHGWRFALSPEAAAWAAGQPAAVRDLRVVERADAAGVFLKPEPGTIRSAFASRDPETEVETGLGFGFWPEQAGVPDRACECNCAVCRVALARRNGCAAARGGDVRDPAGVVPAGLTG